MFLFGEVEKRCFSDIGGLDRRYRSVSLESPFGFMDEPGTGFEFLELVSVCDCLDWKLEPVLSEGRFANTLLTRFFFTRLKR
jgi:hypothetical protein